MDSILFIIFVLWAGTYVACLLVCRPYGARLIGYLLA